MVRHKNSWIPCDERYPETDEYILLSFSNFSLPQVGRYEQDEAGGAFCLGDDTVSCVSYGVVVNAWQPLPPVWQNGVDETCSHADYIRSMDDEEMATELLKFNEVENIIPFCSNSNRCGELLDRGELVPVEMCRMCMLEWLKQEVEEKNNIVEE